MFQLGWGKVPLVSSETVQILRLILLARCLLGSQSMEKEGTFMPASMISCVCQEVVQVSCINVDDETSQQPPNCI